MNPDGDRRATPNGPTDALITGYLEAELDGSRRRASAQQVALYRRPPPALLAGLERFVGDADLQEGRTGWLHTELMLEHLLVEQTDGGWRLSGLFDFEPSWVGPVDYEFSSVGLFVGRGDPAILGAVMREAGVDASPQRLFAMAMVHRYANLGWYHSRLGGPLDLDALAEAWFGH